MENKKVEVRSAVNGKLTVNLPFLRFKRTWNVRNAKYPIDYSILEEAVMDPGVMYYFQRGMLVIEDAAVREHLGLDTEDDPLFFLNDGQMMGLLKVDTTAKFKDALDKMSGEQRVTLAQLAIENELTDLDKIDLLRQYSEVDVAAAIKRSREAKAELKANDTL